MADLTLLKALHEATPEDLEQVKKRIEELQSEVDSLRLVQRVLKAKFSIGDEPKSATSRPPGGTAHPKAVARRKIAKMLLHAGTSRLNAIASGVQMSVGEITDLTDHAWFEDAGNDMVKLTSAGRTVANQA